MALSITLHYILILRNSCYTHSFTYPSQYLHVSTNSGRFILTFHQTALILPRVPIVFTLSSFSKYSPIKPLAVGLSDGENRMILRSFISVWYRRVTNEQTHGAVGRRGSRKKTFGEELASLNFPSPPLLPTPFPSPPHPLNFPSHSCPSFPFLRFPPPSPFLFPDLFLSLPFPITQLYFTINTIW